MDNKRKEFLLNKSKFFCILPWVHMYMDPIGTIRSCCIGPYDKPLGNLHEEQELKSVWNNEKFKKLRLDMLNDIQNKNCQYCYNLERDGASSMRHHSNKQFKHHWDKVLSTANDGSVDYFELPYIDIRWSNICNFKCRSCGPELSSSWLAELVQVFKKPIIANPAFPYKQLVIPSNGVLKPEGIFEQLKPILPTVEEIYFAGGEPLIQDEHYQVLDYLIKNDMTDVVIRYSTNLSKLSHKGKNILDYWPKFNNIRILGSADAMGKRAEYIRHGTKWNIIEDNAKKIVKEVPQHRFIVLCTVSLLNSFHITDFCKNWIEKKIVKPENFSVNLLYQPNFLRMDILPKDYLDQLIERYEEMIIFLKSQCEDDGATSIITFKSAINNIKNSPLSKDQIKQYRKEFLDQISKIDRRRDENFESTFPEFKGLMDYFQKETQ